MDGEKVRAVFLIPIALFLFPVATAFVQQSCKLDAG